ncbi:hypothetical protein Q5P01_015703 [Channa striata]|uniref:Fibronectin type-III domain-containing protein n=1 Tax=Channa striata TaxID=64152 RepID=A0AA88MDS5_CHASR|nr:hypothetical protein Q5P01_015703 [Channa striata]
MKFLCTWETLAVLWIHAGIVPGILCKDGTFSPVSREEVLLLKDEEDPKCFTRTEQDFTCFFESADNGTYDLLYSIERSFPSPKNRCPMSVQGTEEGTFLHICSFPPADVFVYVEIPLDVVKHNTNLSVFNRTVYVEEHMLLDPPFNVSLQQNDAAGQLQVSWCRKGKVYCSNIVHKIRYSTRSLGQVTKEESCLLDDLTPGEEVEVQVALKCALSDKGHWSSWSQPVQARVPQRADDVSLTCYTSDLLNVTCQWNGSTYAAQNEYRLSYKRCLSKTSSCTEWTECLANRHFADRCHFQGDKTGKFLVKLSGAPAPLSRTFYTHKFTLNNSIKTSPPGPLRGALEKGKLCLSWEAPLPFLLAHLRYEVSYQTKEGEAWMMVSLEGPETGTCLEVSAGTHYSVKVRAKPRGPLYSGHWSDWSQVLTGDVPTDTGMLLMLCIPLLMLTTAIILVSVSSSYFSKLKLYFWPPVPNLDKVLQGFLTEINRQKWDPPVTAKQCPEDMPSSVVEIMSEDEVSKLLRPLEESTQLLSPERGFCSRVRADESPGNEVFSDYVTLNKDTVIVCTKGNKYVYEQVGEKVEPVMGDGLLQKGHCSCTDGTGCVPFCLGTEFLNHSYLPIAEAADKFDCKVTATRGPGNLYTNLPCS